MELTTVAFDRPEKRFETMVDEVIFFPPKSATLWVDDVLLYEPGK